MKNQIESNKYASALPLPPLPNDAKFSKPREPKNYKQNKPHAFDKVIDSYFYNETPFLEEEEF